MSREAFHAYTQAEDGIMTRTTRMRATLEMLKLRFGPDVHPLSCEHGYYRRLQVCIDDLLTRLLRCYKKHVKDTGGVTLDELCATPLRCVYLFFHHL